MLEEHDLPEEFNEQVAVCKAWVRNTFIHDHIPTYERE
jgi:hypothetical protein